METKVYVDVLLVINYIINTLLLLCTAKLTGRRPKRRRIVAAALFGSFSALTIFLPFLGFAFEFLLKLLLAAVIVLIAFPPIDLRGFGKQLFVFFSVSFFFCGVMLAVWIFLTPAGMLYYNGVVYFNISPGLLVMITALAYLLLTLANRFARGGRVHAAIYRAQIHYRGGMAAVQGLVDTGNSLYDPFSDTPVVVCRLDDVAGLLPMGAADAIRQGKHEETMRLGLPVRLIPYGNVGGGGMIPAFRPDSITLTGEGGEYRVENVYVGMTAEKIGGTGYSALLNPDLIGIHI